MPKASEVMTNQPPRDGATADRKPARLKDVVTPRTDKPEYVKAEELQFHFPFTIYGVTGPHPSRYGGDRFKFAVAWKDKDETIKRVLTLTANEDRQEIAFQVRKHGAITNCRLYEISLSGDYTYWKIVDVDDPAPENILSSGEPNIAQRDIPF